MAIRVILIRASFVNGTGVKVKLLTGKSLLKMNSFEIAFVSGNRKIYNFERAIASP